MVLGEVRLGHCVLKTSKYLNELDSARRLKIRIVCIANMTIVLGLEENRNPGTR